MAMSRAGRADSANRQDTQGKPEGDGEPPADSERRERSTFLSLEEILDIVVADCRSIADRLQAIQHEDEDERRRLALSGIERRERELCEVLVAYREQAPASLLRMQAQYVAGGPLDLPTGPGGELDVQDVRAFVVSIHESLEQMLESLASDAVSETEEEAFEALAGAIRASKTQLARGALGVDDL